MAEGTDPKSMPLPPSVFRLVARIVRLLIRGILALEVKGGDDFPRTGPVLVASNHLSYADVPLLAAFLPRVPVFLTKREVLDIPILGLILRLFGPVPVRRGEADRQAVRRCLHVLGQDDVLAVFPEGTRSRTGRLQAARAGIGLLARRTEAPVVPVAITGTDRLARRLPIRAPVRITIGSPLTAAELVPDGGCANATAITEAIMVKIAALLPPAYRGHYASSVGTAPEAPAARTAE